MVQAYLTSTWIKTYANGDKEWEKTLGGTDADVGHGVQQTEDGGYIVVGTTWSSVTGEHDVYLMRTYANGDKEWEKTFGGTDDDIGRAVQQTEDGGYIIVGETWSFAPGEPDVYLIKTYADGDKEWEKTFGGGSLQFGYSVQQTEDGGYIVVGETWSFAPGVAEPQNVYLIKTCANGDKEWEKTFGGTDVDVGLGVQQTTDGGYIITGLTRSFGAGEPDVYLIKTYANGDKEWEKTLGGADDDFGRAVQQTTDGGYIIAGITDSFGAGSSDVYLIKTDVDGNELWSKAFGGSDRDSEHQCSRRTMMAT